MVIFAKGTVPWAFSTRLLHLLINMSVGYREVTPYIYYSIGPDVIEVPAVCQVLWENTPETLLHDKSI